MEPICFRGFFYGINTIDSMHDCIYNIQECIVNIGGKYEEKKNKCISIGNSVDF